MKVVMFQRRFVTPIECGIKTSTIRLSSRLKPGDRVSMRYWAGAPYRSKQIEFHRTTICRTSTVWMGYTPFNLPWIAFGKRINLLTWAQWERLGRDEGFKSAWGMFEWFLDNHDMPFCGLWASWVPLLLPHPGDCIETNAQEELWKQHGTPFVFFRAMARAMVDGFITIDEFARGMNSYTSDWWEAGRNYP